MRRAHVGECARPPSPPPAQERECLEVEVLRVEYQALRQGFAALEAERDNLQGEKDELQVGRAGGGGSRAGQEVGCVAACWPVLLTQGLCAPGSTRPPAISRLAPGPPGSSQMWWESARCRTT